MPLRREGLQLRDVDALAARLARDGVVRARRDRHPLEERDGHHDAAQLVVAVGPRPEDLEREVDLGRCLDRRGGHGGTGARPAAATGS